MATTDPSLIAAFSKSLPAWARLEKNASAMGATKPEMLACHAFGARPDDVLAGKATRGFAFGSLSFQFPQSVLIRGDAAAVLIVLQAAEDAQKTFGVFVRQPRVAIGRTDFLELVAGMLDRSHADERISIADAIRKEVEEETHQSFAPEDFVNLTRWQRLHAKGRPGFLANDDLTHGSPTTPGGCDECIHFFCVTKVMPLAEILSLRGLVGGNSSEHERTLVTILPFEDALFVCTDVKFLSAWALYQSWNSAFAEAPKQREYATPGLARMGLRCTVDVEGRRTVMIDDDA